MPEINTDEWIITFYSFKLKPISFIIEEHLNIENGKKYFMYYITVLEEKIHQSENYASSMEEATSKSLKMISKMLHDFNISVQEFKI